MNETMAAAKIIGMVSYWLADDTSPAVSGYKNLLRDIGVVITKVKVCETPAELKEVSRVL